MIKVSIIIVNYNTAQLLDDCITSIYKNCIDNNYEIIVVDNSSKDDSVERIKNKFNKVILIENKENYGFGKANNIGSKYSNGEYLLLLNSDTIVLNNIVSEFVRYYENNKDKQIGCLGAWLYNEENKLNISYGGFPNKKQIIKDYLDLCINRRKYFNNLNLYTDNKVENQLDVDYVTGALMFMKTDVFNELKGFDEDFFMYYEETELQYRMAKQGYKRIIIDTSKVIHLEGKSPSKSNFKRIIYSESMYKFFKKHSNKFKYSLFKFTTLILRIPTFISKQYSLKENIEFYKRMIKL